MIEKLKNKPHIIIANKSDIKKFNLPYEFIEISAKNNENIETIKKKIIEKTISHKIDFSKIVLTNERHLNILRNLQNQIENEFIKRSINLDIEAFKLKNIWKELGKISGTTEDEKIIDLVFSKFCLGK